MGNFTIGLLEILAYLTPGCLALGALLFIRFPDLAHQVTDKLGNQFAFIICSYIIGHLLTIISVQAVRVRSAIKWLLKSKTREKRISYYPDLQQKLHSVFSSKITKDDKLTLRSERLRFELDEFRINRLQS